MKHLKLDFLLVVVLFSMRLEVANGLVKVVAVGNRIDLGFDKRMVNVTFSFYQPKDVLNQSLEVRFETLRQFNNLRLLFVYYSTALNGAVQNILIKRQINICLFLRRPSSDRLLKTFYDYIKARGHLPTRCPVEKGVYSMGMLRSSEFPLPAFLPETEFIFELIYQSEVREKSLAEFRLYGKLHRIVDKILP